MATQQAVRRWILTGSVTAITITGALYGAGLKTNQERAQVCHRHSTSIHLFIFSRVYKNIVRTALTDTNQTSQERKRIMALSPDEKIAQYEAVIEEWERTKKELERKLERHHARKRGEDVGEGDRRMSK